MSPLVFSYFYFWKSNQRKKIYVLKQIPIVRLIWKSNGRETYESLKENVEGFHLVYPAMTGAHRCLPVCYWSECKSWSDCYIML